jgi:uncharacterized protein YbjT (DUF2867 family)
MTCVSSLSLARSAEDLRDARAVVVLRRRFLGFIVGKRILFCLSSITNAHDALSPLVFSQSNESEKHMKIVVFGSTGGVGQHVVRHAVEAGHTVTAFLRSPEKLEVRDGVTVVQGDACDAEAVAQAIDGQDAVISCLSSSAPMKPSTEVAQMTQNIVAGMQRAGIDRIAYCASAGVENELTGAIGKSVMWMLRNALTDHKAAIAHITEADLNATIARPTGLSNDEFTLNYLEAFDGMPAGFKSIPRSSVAQFLVKAIEQPEVYGRTSVGLALGKKE